MQKHPAPVQSARTFFPPLPEGEPLLALNEFELAARWRQEQLGPIYCKLGRRVTYLLHEIEAFERRVSRYSSFTRAYQ